MIDQDEGQPASTGPTGAITSDQLSQLQLRLEQPSDQGRSLMSDLRTLVHDTVSQDERLGEEWQQRPAPPVVPPTREERLRGEYGMTPREVEVAELLALGLSNVGVAGRLRISPHTARHHTQRVLAKLGVHSRAEAAAKLAR
ncbi:MAG TPA: helix-turn-helix transcriptional regulator [Gemmatimonadales bacterium]|nr:helix-turn-helix transcriptional regulator [Gemmatimonadales bacterium]